MQSLFGFDMSCLEGFHVWTPTRKGRSLASRWLNPKRFITPSVSNILVLFICTEDFVFLYNSPTLLHSVSKHWSSFLPFLPFISFAWSPFVTPRCILLTCSSLTIPFEVVLLVSTISVSFSRVRHRPSCAFNCIACVRHVLLPNVLVLKRVSIFHVIFHEICI